MCEFTILKNQIIIDVIQDKNDSGLDIIKFVTSDLTTYALECYEDLRDTESYLESIDGDLDDLKLTTILLAELVEETNGDNHFAFYKLSTEKGDVTLRFNYTEAPWYSGSVQFKEIDTDYSQLSDEHTCIIFETQRNFLNLLLNTEIYVRINNIKKYRDLTDKEKNIIKDLQSLLSGNSLTYILDEEVSSNA